MVFSLPETGRVLRRAAKYWRAPTHLRLSWTRAHEMRPLRSSTNCSNLCRLSSHVGRSWRVVGEDVTGMKPFISEISHCYESLPYEIRPKLRRRKAIEVDSIVSKHRISCSLPCQPGRSSLWQGSLSCDRVDMNQDGRLHSDRRKTPFPISV